LDVLGLDISGMSVLEICGGSGMMAEKFARAGATVTGTDFSPAAIARARERSRRYHFDGTFLVADAENLAFADRSFDIVAAHDGLHHLDNPERAISEMARVARRGILILDPARAALTKVAVWLGIAVEVAEAGNQGYGNVPWNRTLMYYPHQPGRLFRWFDQPAAFLSYRIFFVATNLVLGRFGNKLSLAAMRNH